MKEMVRFGKLSPNPVTSRIATLTTREHEVITLVSKGLKNRDIGDRLFISETTVRHHLTSVFEKLEVSNRLELIIFALTHKLTSLPEQPEYGGNGHPGTFKVYELGQTM
jgi:DNA-binding NarL/FixJ family response regulator